MAHGVESGRVQLLQRREPRRASSDDVDAELAAALAEIPENTEESRQHGRATLNRVARRLQKLDWHSIAPVTDDFVVFAVDLELTHLEENLRYSVPAALRKRLAAQRLLG